MSYIFASLYEFLFFINNSGKQKLFLCINLGNKLRVLQITPFVCNLLYNITNNGHPFQLPLLYRLKWTSFEAIEYCREKNFVSFLLLPKINSKTYCLSVKMSKHIFMLINNNVYFFSIKYSALFVCIWNNFLSSYFMGFFCLSKCCQSLQRLWCW